MVIRRDGQDVAVELCQSFCQQTPSRSCVVTGERGRLVVDLMTPSLEVQSRDGAVIRRESFEGFERNDLFVDEMKNFLAAIDGGRVAVPARDGAVSLRIALAAKQSLRTGETVNLQ
jgi:predicted dehydrogenase